MGKPFHDAVGVLDELKVGAARKLGGLEKVDLLGDAHVDGLVAGDVEGGKVADEVVEADAHLLHAVVDEEHLQASGRDLCVNWMHNYWQYLNCSMV